MLSEDRLKRIKNRLQEEFTGYYEHGGGADYRYHHLCRVHRYVKRLIEKPEIADLEFDEDVVELAALLHDVGRAEDIEDGYLNPFKENQHAGESANRIDAFVENMSPDRLGLLRTVVSNHHSEADTVEGKILQDADRLDGFGVHDIWRMVHYAAEEEDTLDDGLKYFWEEAVDRYEQELDLFHFEVARKTAENRLEQHKTMMKRIETEENGNDI